MWLLSFVPLRYYYKFPICISSASILLKQLSPLGSLSDNEVREGKQLFFSAKTWATSLVIWQTGNFVGFYAAKKSSCIKLQSLIKHFISIGYMYEMLFYWLMSFVHSFLCLWLGKLCYLLFKLEPLKKQTPKLIQLIFNKRKISQEFQFVVGYCSRNEGLLEDFGPTRYTWSDLKGQRKFGK